MPKKTRKPLKTPRQGICSNCNNEADCKYLENCDQPVFHCDQYDGYAPPPKKRGKVSGQRSQTKPVNEESFPYKGLCRDCENRKTCTFPKPEGGVWHCDEYR